MDPSFDVAVSLFSVIGYLTEPQDLQAAIGNVAAHLHPGGVLLVEGWVETDYCLGNTVSAESGRTEDLAVARTVRSFRNGMLCDIEMRYLAATPQKLTSTAPWQRGPGCRPRV